MTQIQPQDQIIAIGSRLKKVFKDYHIIKNLDHLEIDFTYDECRALGTEVLTKFNYHEVSGIKIAYAKAQGLNHFEPLILDLLPIKSNYQPSEFVYNVEFEPNYQTVIESAIPIYICTLIYGAIMESKLVEYAARCLATEKAIENSKKIQEELLIKYNQFRQNKITQEIIEVMNVLTT
jgi:F-type H+-transporting ATPase subunit gamma